MRELSVKRTLLALGALLFAASANAATLDITATETAAGDVVLAGSGSIDLTGLSLYVSEYPVDVSENSTDFNYFIGAEYYDVYSINFFEGLNLLSDTAFSFTRTGDGFGFQEFMGFEQLVVDLGYVSGQAIDFSWVVADTTVAALDLNFGTLATFGNNTVTLVNGVSTVPLPASLVLLIAALGTLGGAARLGRNRAA